MQKSSYLSDHYRPGTSRRRGSVATFREQMTDYARGDKLLELRQQRRLSRETVAHEIGVTTKTLYTWEMRSGPIKFEPNATALGEFYGVDADELVTRDRESTAPSSRGQVLEGFEEFRAYVSEIKAEIRSNRLEIEQQNDLLDQQTKLIEGMREAQAALLEAARRLIERATEDAGEWDGTERRTG